MFSWVHQVGLVADRFAGEGQPLLQKNTNASSGNLPGFRLTTLNHGLPSSRHVEVLDEQPMEAT